MKQLATVILILSLSLVNATDFDKMYIIVAQIESSNIATAVGDGGKAYGILQIHKICVDDINRIYGTSFLHHDAFDVCKSKEMFVLYLQAGIKRYVRLYNRQPTEEEVVRMWNGGIYQGYKRKSTIKYYRKYNNLRRELLQRDC